jgi:hypothetical protein
VAPAGQAPGDQRPSGEEATGNAPDRHQYQETTTKVRSPLMPAEAKTGT